MRAIRLDFTTDGSGAATVTGASANGTLYAVQLVDGNVDDGVDITLTSENGDLSIPLLVAADWNSDKVLYPRVLGNLNTDGTALTTHTEPLVFGALKAVIAQGGATKTGALICYVRENL